MALEFIGNDVAKMNQKKKFDELAGMTPSELHAQAILHFVLGGVPRNHELRDVYYSKSAAISGLAILASMVERGEIPPQELQAGKPQPAEQPAVEPEYHGLVTQSREPVDWDPGPPLGKVK